MGLMAFALIAFSACGTSGNEAGTAVDAAQQEEVHSDGAAHAHDEQVATYQCPMKCEGDKTYTEAGNCPVCKMNLKEV